MRLFNETPRRKQRGISKELFIIIRPKGRGIEPGVIPRLRSGSVRLNDFDTQNQSLTDLK